MAAPRFRCYGITVVAIGAAFALARPFGATSIWLILAVLASSLYGGVGPGIAAVTLSAAALVSFVAEPHLPTFLVAAAAVVAFVEARRRADIRERQAEETLNTRLTVDRFPGMVATLTANGEPEFLNSQLLEYFGKTAEELKDWPSILHPMDRGRVVQAFMDSMATGGPLDVEQRGICADGSYRWFTNRGLPMYDRRGQIVRWYHLITDIDDRKRTEEALRASELNFRTIVESIPGMVGTMTATGELDFANRRVLTFLGTTLEGLRDWARYVHPEDRDWVVTIYQRAIATGDDLDLECRVLRADGAYRWLRYRGHTQRDSDGRVTRRYFLQTDIEDLKQAQEAARANELKFRLTIDNIPGLAFTCTNAGELEFVNKRVMEFFGKTLDELKDWSSFVHPEDRPRLVAQWTRSVETGQILDEELRLRRADGSYGWAHSRHLPFREADGPVIRWYCLITDIDARKRAEEALRASEREVRLILNSIPGCVTVQSASGEIELVNQPCLDYYGKTLDEIKDWSYLVYPDDLEPLVALWKSSLETGHPLDVEVRLRRADGVYRWFYAGVRPLRDEADRVTRWYSLLIDIDDRKRAEEALRASERELSLIVESIPGLAWCASPEDGQPTYVNRRILDYVGKSQNEFVQNGWDRCLHPDDKDRAVPAWIRAVTTGQPFESRLRFRATDGSYRWFQALAELGRDDSGRPTRWYGLLIDIDDRVNLEEELRGVQERLLLATKTATLGELSASIAHEVGQPLAAVVANGHACLRWLSAHPPNLAKALEAAERVTRDGTEAGEIVRRIRALFKRAPFEKLKLDLNDVIRESLVPFRSQMTLRDIALVTELTSEILPVAGDRIQLQQLLLNLFSNAMEAMEPVHDRPRVLCVRSHRRSVKEVIVEVQDSGVGVHSQDKIFETFFTTKKEGMGMGLAICRSIVEAHHGRLWCSSPEGPGAIFSLALPVLPETTQ